MREQAATFFKELQDAICDALCAVDGTGAFEEDLWQRDTTSKVMHGGGGRTRIMQNGSVFEQGGVNFSEVHGCLPTDMSQKLIDQPTPSDFYATGVSLVLHPESPLVPTTHANFRFLNVGDFSWFGGGMDLTPYYIDTDDCKHFHTTIKTACDPFDISYYPTFKQHCDEYFYLPHRKETRGVGGIFFDYLGKDAASNLGDIFSFVQSVGLCFIPAYIPIVERQKNKPYSDEQKSFQLLRRGRYVEFNLLYDRGTQFGLKTGGRTESILMSLPPNVRWEYCAEFPENSEEQRLINILQNPRSWV